ncbi:MAG: glycosyltransferase family 2 protein [Bacteroidetes bacterium]|nr:glycosyltransferase family 2 protein [Bacteroidota bacterium]
MPSPLVSIITATYNHEKYIADCIRSVQAQTFSGWEMLLVNDGSMDKTLEVAESFSKQDSRIKVFNQKNIGVFRLAETYNFALSKAQGKYITILEGDDKWEKDKLERQVKTMETDEKIILTWGPSYPFTANISKIPGEYPSQNPEKVKYYNNEPVGSILNLLYFENCMGALTLMIRKKTLEEIGGFKQGFGLPLVDLPTLLELSMKGNFYFDNHDFGKWRVYAKQITKTYPVEIIKGRFEAAKAHYEKYRPQLEINFSEVENYFQKIILTGYARAGRYKLIAKDFAGARKDYAKAICYKGFSQFSWRLRAGMGYVLSFFHLDVEWLAKLLGKKTYTKN